MRIFTNEEATANALARASVRVEPVAWSDPMAFGRLPFAAELDAYASERAKVIAACGWEEADVAAADLRLSYDALRVAAKGTEEAPLLFGGSLRDQLQLAQILCWLSNRPETEWLRFRLMIVDGPLSIFDDGALLEVARDGSPIGFGTLEAYRSAWLAVTSGDPSHVGFALRRLRKTREELTLASALERWLQELPSCENGLSITEGQILDAVRLGVHAPRELFEAVQETEAAPFRTNWEFWQEIDRLTKGDEPLLRVAEGDRFLCPPKDLAWNAFHAQRLELTDAGEAVLTGGRHAVETGRPERWLGGARIERTPRWFWSYSSLSVEREARRSARAGE